MVKIIKPTQTLYVKGTHEEIVEFSVKEGFFGSANIEEVKSLSLINENVESILISLVEHENGETTSFVLFMDRLHNIVQSIVV